ncbi:MAG: BolA family transcriptional regulator [Alphaproteobacteria bacterium]|nr:BolA family transcriptional regulator [Alphaproteobacteria bacterium]
MTLSDLIRKKITEHFEPEHLLLVNESHKHRGHAGDDGSGETHFYLEVSSARFIGKSRLERHRLVYAALDGFFPAGLHALSLKTFLPGEFKKTE